MKRKRTIYFEKRKDITDVHYGENIFDTSCEYTTISDLRIAKETLNILNNIENLKYRSLIEWEFDDWSGCRITIKSNKADFMTFVEQFLNIFENEIKGISFKK